MTREPETDKSNPPNETDRRGAVTRLIQSGKTDDPEWAAQLLPLIYDESEESPILVYG